MQNIALLLHVLGATVWTGGHLILALAILPGALRNRAYRDIRQFESAYERIGIPALILQVATGVYLAFARRPEFANWFDIEDPVARLILVKLGLLLATVLFALDARLRIIPNLNEENLKPLAYHIVPVTLFSVAFVVAGVSFRTGWFY